jgi:MFS family permease
VAAGVRDRDLRVVAGAIGVSAAGDFVALVALALRANDMQGSGIAVSAVFICLWAPIAVLAGHVGVLVDRVEATRLLALVSALQAVVAAVLAFTGTFWLLLLLTALLGTGVAIAQAAEFAVVPRVIGRRSLQRANALVETTRYIGFSVGPLLGGALKAVGGTETAMLVDAVSFVAIALVALTLPRRSRPSAAGEKRRARDGIVFLGRDPQLALAMTVAFVSLLFMSASIPADLLYAQDVLGVEDVGFGLVLTGWTVGMVLAANLLAPRVPTRALALAAFAAVAIQGLGKAAAPLWLTFGFMVVCYVVGGAGHGVKNTTFRTLIHQRVPEELHGRAFAAYNGLRNTAELVALAAGGVLVGAVGPRATLWLAGGVSALAGFAGLGALVARRSRAAEAEASVSTIGSP